MTKTKWIVLAVVVVVALYTGGVYNGLVKSNESINGQWAQVETQYQRRFDLIPNLVNATKGILTQEQKVFGDIAAARTQYTGAKSVEERVTAANQVESALGRLLALVENYPVLRSSENIQTLMVQLEGTENRISVERERFNEKVRDFNTTVKRFPGNIIASSFGFDARDYFESQEGANAAPKVDLQ